MADELSAHESALRKLPLPYSLALRLRDAGVAPEVVSEYVGVEEGALDGVYRIAEAKLMAAQARTEVCRERSWGRQKSLNFAVRVESRDAGVRLKSDAAANQIADAVRAVLADASFRQAPSRQDAVRCGGVPLLLHERKIE